MTNQKNKYIWYCPNCKDSVILFKTDRPSLGEGEIRCYKCRNIFTFFEITISNKHVIERYLELLKKVINR